LLHIPGSLWTRHYSVFFVCRLFRRFFAGVLALILDDIDTTRGEQLFIADFFIRGDIGRARIAARGSGVGGVPASDGLLRFFALRLVDGLAGIVLFGVAAADFAERRGQLQFYALARREQRDCIFDVGLVGLDEGIFENAGDGNEDVRIRRADVALQRDV
jgi:hypothetical protein